MYEKMQESGPSEIMPLMHTLAIWVRVLLFPFLSPLRAWLTSFIYCHDGQHFSFTITGSLRVRCPQS